MVLDLGVADKKEAKTSSREVTLESAFMDERRKARTPGLHVCSPCIKLQTGCPEMSERTPEVFGDRLFGQPGFL